MTKRGRWYGGGRGVARGVVQDHPSGLPMEILALAHEEYALNHTQTLELIQERGGFSIGEVVQLLADHVERLKGKK